MSQASDSQGHYQKDTSILSLLGSWKVQWHPPQGTCEFGFPTLPLAPAFPPQPRGRPSSWRGGWLTAFSGKDSFPPLLGKLQGARLGPSAALAGSEGGAPLEGPRWEGQGLQGTHAALALSAAVMPLPARLRGARQALTPDKQRPGQAKSHTVLSLQTPPPFFLRKLPVER